MSTGSRRGGSYGALALLLSISLLAGISGLTAGRGNLGRDSGLTNTIVGGKGSTALLTPGQVTVTIGAFSKTESWAGMGDTTSALRTRLVTAIDADASFSANSTMDPNDPNTVSFEVLTQGGGEIPQMEVCETFADIHTLGTSFTAGQGRATFQKATTISNVNFDPNTGAPVYTLTVVALANGLYTKTYTTSTAPNDTPAGLNMSIRTDLEIAGFTVSDDGTTFTVSRAGDKITSLKIFSNDTGVHDNCILMAPAVGAFPTLTEAGMLVLMLVLAFSAVAMLRRNGRRLHHG